MFHSQFIHGTHVPCKIVLHGTVTSIPILCPAKIQNFIDVVKITFYNLGVTYARQSGGFRFSEVLQYQKYTQKLEFFRKFSDTRPVRKLILSENKCIYSTDYQNYRCVLVFLRYICILHPTHLSCGQKYTVHIKWGNFEQWGNIELKNVPCLITMSQ